MQYHNVGHCIMEGDSEKVLVIVHDEGYKAEQSKAKQSKAKQSKAKQSNATVPVIAFLDRTRFHATFLSHETCSKANLTPIILFSLQNSFKFSMKLAHHSIFLRDESKMTCLLASNDL